VKAGETIERGRAVGLLEVMKTFSRVQYGGNDLPERARVRAVLPKDGDDVNAGDVILELEELP
jgi:acetyl-CoA carboxylase biotin carboxyl carrier protein